MHVKTYFTIETSHQGAPDSLTTQGDIFRAPRGDYPDPKVVDVFVKVTQSPEFGLDPGNYEYHFQVENGDGEFVLRAIRKDDKLVLQRRQFNTGDKALKYVFEFFVEPAN